MGLVADVFKCLIINPDDDEVVASTTLQDANIEVTMNANDVRAGQGNDLIAILHSSRDINVPLTDVEWKYEYLAMQLGQDIATKAGVAFAMPKWYEATSNEANIEITLDEEPLASDSGLKIYDEDGVEIVKTTGYTISGKVVTLLDSDAGDKIEVRIYKYTTSENTEQIAFDATVFPKDFILALETIEIDHDEQPTHKLQFIFDRAKPQGNINLNTTSERNASTQEISFRVLKPKTSTEVGRALRIPIEAS